MTGEGLDDVLDVVRQRMEDRVMFSPKDSMISNLRHRELLSNAAKLLGRARECIIAGSSEEVPLVDLHAAMSLIGEITGEVTIDDIYQHIFSNFCIGK